ncbi:molecular chaperone DnaJ [Halococcoides cellulosivorans]|uniref:Chaperone protein DnaJ n=1 Tax=Halococcoides cellulosivorans TaxID=1679096 RepID=A0A2R4X125_9EURY|nr:molecular chaperone DnaJ [Halococcoides cellulosivorans]AWB27498.1 molecular chaperone DnaJ [Halococcoides cellulosivorans]
MSEDFYEVLGVSRDADSEEIKSAYRDLASEYHPDVSDDPDAEEKFKKVKKAKEVLTDDEQREMYDQLGHDRYVEADKRGATENGGAGRRRQQGNPFGGGGMGDIFDQFFGGGGRSRGQDRNRPQQGRDLRTDLTIDLEDAFHGRETQVTVRRPTECESCDGAGHPPDASSRTCDECDGHGQVTTVQRTPMGRIQQTQTCPRCDGRGEVFSETCSECRGDGVVREKATLQVEIPAGIQDGQTLRMNGEGAPGENGGPPGDLLIDVSIEDHDVFERDGRDLHRRVAVSFPQAVFGDEITVETIDGELKMDVPAGTQSGEVFRLRGEGMPHLHGRRQGDLYVKVQVVTPDDLTEEQREALKAFAEAGGEEIDVDRGFFEKLKDTF